MPSSKFYDDNEAEEILRLAIHDSTAGAMTRERLLATAAELGITEDAIVRAEEEMARRKTDVERQEIEAAEFAEYKAHHRRSVFTGLGSWASTSVMLIVINLFTSRTITWSIWPVGIWGLVMAGQILQALLTPVARDEKFESWKAKRLKGAEAK